MGGTLKKGKVIASFRILRINLKSLLLFELAYKAVTFLLFVPLVRRLETLTLYLNHVSVLSNYNFLKVFSNPVTWLMILAILVLTAAFTAIELAGLTNGIHASYSGVKITAKEMFNEGISDAGRIFSLHNWMFMVYVFLVMPLADVYSSATITENFAIPGFLMETIHDLNWLEILYYAAIAVLCVVAVRWIYVIPSMAVNNSNFKDAAQESTVLTKKHVFSIFMTLAGWLLIEFLLYSGITLAAILCLRWLTAWLDPTVNLDQFMESGAVIVMVIVTLFAMLLAGPMIFIRIFIGYSDRKEQLSQPIPEFRKSYTWINRYRWLRLIIAASLAVGVYYFVPARYQEIKRSIIGKITPTLVMAHRGDSADAPENTLPAFQAAMDNGADAAEMDVQMTKDGQIVVLHDSSIKRTTGVNKKIWEVTYDEIKDLDNGSFFSSSFSDTRIPTLDQVIKLCKGKLYLNIEIKRTGHDDGIEQKVLDIINANDFQDECDITSMDYKTLETVHSLDPDITTVYTTTIAYGSMTKLDAADAFSVEGTFVDEDFVRSLHEKGKKIYVWTVDDQEEMDKMIDMDVDVIITNRPKLCRKEVDASNGMLAVFRRIETALKG